MENFEALRHITIGQYIPGDSLVHRLDPRVKISALMILALVISLDATIMGNLILFCLALAVVLLSQVPLGYILGGIRPALPLIVILALLQLIFYNSYVPPTYAPVVLVHWGPIVVTTGSLHLVFISILRFLGLLFLASLLTNTTTTTELAHGIEGMLRPFSWTGLPSHELSLVATVALRFVPILAMELEDIAKAQASRGASLFRGERLSLTRNVRQATSLVVPLFLAALRRAEDLVLAMETRCYLGGKERTHLARLEMHRRDLAVLGLLLLFGGAMLVWRNKFPI